MIELAHGTTRGQNGAASRPVGAARARRRAAAAAIATAGVEASRATPDGLRSSDMQVANHKRFGVKPPSLRKPINTRSNNERRVFELVGRQTIKDLQLQPWDVGRELLDHPSSDAAVVRVRQEEEEEESNA